MSTVVQEYIKDATTSLVACVSSLHRESTDSLIVCNALNVCRGVTSWNDDWLAVSGPSCVRDSDSDIVASVTPQLVYSVAGVSETATSPLTSIN